MSTVCFYRAFIQSDNFMMFLYYFKQYTLIVLPVIYLPIFKYCTINMFFLILTIIYIYFDCRITQSQKQVAMISEMIHTASLVHDDVIDNSSTRRGKPTVDSRWGQRKVRTLIIRCKNFKDVFEM